MVDSKKSKPSYTPIAIVVIVMYLIPYLILSFILMDLAWIINYSDSIVSRVVITGGFIMWTLFTGCVVGDSIERVIRERRCVNR